MIAVAARRLRTRVGRRGALLVLLGTIALLYGISLITIPPPPPTPGLRLLLSRMPLHGWGITLTVAGVTAVLCAPLRQGRDWPGFAALILVWLPWSASYFVSWWPQGDNHRGWVTCLIFASLAGVPAVGAGWQEPGTAPPAAQDNP